MSKNVGELLANVDGVRANLRELARVSGERPFANTSAVICSYCLNPIDQQFFNGEGTKFAY
ncbi:MAG: hypothetical protein GY774_06350 [Planctomycetes bacterium]|nr:hypothetical protein [Planctomycetota bacterium]